MPVGATNIGSVFSFGHVMAIAAKYRFCELYSGDD